MYASPTAETRSSTTARLQPAFGGRTMPFFQPKLTVNAPGDAYEQEADRVADQVMRMQTGDAPILQRSSLTTLSNVHRKCAECEQEDQAQRKEANGSAGGFTAPPVVHQTLAGGGGRPMDVGTRQFMESRFGQDFGQVRIHTGSQAAESAQAIRARAYTSGRDIVFGRGEYQPGNDGGKRLLAHELAHVGQQGGKDIIKTKRIGTRFSHSPGVVSPYRRISGRFDGRIFTLYGDGTPIYSVDAQSGRPYSVSSSDAASCSGSTSDSYMNNPLYVGIRDNGPIPEGTYRFSASQIATFSFSERTEMLLGGSYTDPFGRSLHGGDWGSGRVALNPVRIIPGPRGCGNTSARSGFYLHGGVMPGSSGCIDIGNSGFDSLVGHLQGYRGNIEITVRYTHPAPDVGVLDRALGRFTYPTGASENPSLLDRVGSFFDF